MFTKSFYVYLLTNTRNNVLYVGMTNNLERRIAEHRMKVDADSFASRYNLWKVVYMEETSEPMCAIQREKEIKGWVRCRKDELVNLVNPEWKNLLP